MTKTVMVVDDSVSMRQLVSFALKDAGYEVVPAVNGKDAFDKLNGTRIDMVITDLNMPEMNGVDFIKKLRGKFGYKFTPVVMLTTESRETNKQEGREAGASGWLVKPFTPQQLIEVVKKFVK